MLRYYIQWEAGSEWILSGEWCSGYVEELFEPDLDPGRVAEEIATNYLPDSDVHSAPENGRVPTNFPVIFYAVEDSYHETENLLGAQIEIEANATQFQWDWDSDGTVDHTTTRPGVAYDGSTRNPDYIKHPYASKGSYTADLTVIWEGRFRVEDGEWRDLPLMTVQRGSTGDITVLDTVNRLGNN